MATGLDVGGAGSGVGDGVAVGDSERGTVTSALPGTGLVPVQAIWARIIAGAENNMILGMRGFSGYSPLICLAQVRFILEAGTGHRPIHQGGRDRSGSVTSAVPMS